VEFQAGILRFMRERDYTRVETRPEQVVEWTETVIKAAEPLLSSKVDSWQTGVNRNVEGRSVRRVLGYNLTHPLISLGYKRIGRPWRRFRKESRDRRR
jgi:hypothetical protein